MGCIEFWAVNSLVGSVMFFIVFLVVEGQPHFYPYPVTKKGDSATALILASIGYAGVGVLLIFWYFYRQRRLQQALQYQPTSGGPQPRMGVIKAQSLEI